MFTPHLNLKGLAAKLSQKLTITISLIALASPQLALASFRYPPTDANAYPPFDALCTDEEMRALVRELNNPEQVEPEQVEFVFNALTACGSEAAPMLARLFQFSSPEQQSQALEALIEIGPDAKAAIPILAAGLSSTDNSLSARIPYALAKIGGADVLSILLSALGHPDTQVKARAISALGLLGADAQPAVPALREALRDPELQPYAADRLGDIGPGAGFRAFGARNVAAETLIKLSSLAVPELITALADDDVKVYSRAAYALGEIGSPVIADLSATLNHPDANVRRRAAFALGKVGQPAVPMLLKALQSDTLAVRKAAAYGLGIAEVPSQEVIAALQLMVDDDSIDLDLRRTAASALELLGVEQSSFFLAFNLFGAQTAVCPRIDFESYEFDPFTGDCLVTYEEFIALAGLGDILTRLCVLFGC